MSWIKDRLEKEISETDEVLDLCCGKGVTIKGLRCKRLVGVDIYEPWLREYPGEQILSDVCDLRLERKSYDVVMVLDGLEHLRGKNDVFDLVSLMERVARKKVIIYTPKKFEKQDDLGNPFNQHRGLITTQWFEDNGYTVSSPPPDFQTLAIKEVSNG